MPALLSPAALIYDTLTQRRAQSSGYRSRIPVICVGNFVAGGTGKTPFVRALCHHLVDRCLCPTILTRGYGGALSGPVFVDTEMHTTADVGDEAWMLAQHFRVMVAANRADGARAIEADATEASVIVMDDGLLNPSLEASVRFALVDRNRRLGNARVIPAGPLRAKIAFQRRRVDAIFYTGLAKNGAANFERLPQLDGLEAASVVSSARVSQASGNQSASQRVFVFSGIANPMRVVETATALGLDVTGHRFFPDHHTFLIGELSHLADAAASVDSELITTEKDYVRLRTGSGHLASIARRVRVIFIETDFDTAGRAVIDRYIDRALRTTQSGPR